MKSWASKPYFQNRTEHHWWTSEHLQSISDISKLRCLHRFQRILEDNTHPAPVCSPYCHLTTDTKASTPIICESQLLKSVTKTKQLTLFSWLNKQNKPIDLKRQHNLYCLTLFICGGLCHLSSLIIILGLYFPLRTTKNTYFWVCIITSLILWILTLWLWIS